jgi:hypothetical protein
MLIAACKVPTTIVILYSDTSRRSIFDARLNFGIEKGDVIAFEFTTLKIIKTWPTMNLPDTSELRQKVADMGSSKIRTNFAFPKSRKRKRVA